MSPTDRDCAIIREAMRLWALREDATKPTNHWQTTRVVTDHAARIVYSYGRHFPLAVVYPRGRNGGLLLLNGDTAGAQGWRRTRTNDHQAATQRTAADICREAPGWQVVILPMSAIDGAGIDAATVKPLDIQPDTIDRFSHCAILPPDTFGAAPTRGMVDNPRAHNYRGELTGAPLLVPTDRTNERARVTLTVESAGAGIDRAGIAPRVTCEATVTRTTVWARGAWHGGDWQVTDLDQPEYAYAVSGAIGASQSSQYPTGVSADRASNGTIELGWSSSRHWLGECLFTAVRVSESSRPCHTANPAAADTDWCPQCGSSLRRDGIERRTDRRRYRWLSAFDYQESPALYFLAALPTSSRARSVAMAIEDLAPRAVHAALARGLAVERQGDIFLIPTKLTDTDLANRGADRARLTMHTRGAKPRAGEIGYQAPLTAAQRRSMAEWRRNEWRRLMRLDANRGAQPVTDRGARASFAALRAKHADTLAAHNAKLTGAIFGADTARRRVYGYMPLADMSPRQARSAILRAVASARSALDYESRHGGADSHGRSTVAHARDWYRRHDRNRALELWRQAATNAAMKYQPAAVIGAPVWNANRERALAALAIYGTAHTATDVAVTKSGTYARGTVRHVPAVANERRDADHRPLTLAADTWYLAVRNTVPRMRGIAAPMRRRL